MTKIPKTLERKDEEKIKTGNNLQLRPFNSTKLLGNKVRMPAEKLAGSTPAAILPGKEKGRRVPGQLNDLDFTLDCKRQMHNPDAVIYLFLPSCRMNQLDALPKRGQDS
jgi:hypothetical protein